MPKLLQHLHQPLTVPRGFQSDQRRRRQLPIPSFRFAVAIHQLLLCHLGSLVVEPGNLLPAGMVITPYNKHRRLLSSPASFLVLNRKRRLRIEREPSLLSNQPKPILLGWGFSSRITDFSPVTGVFCVCAPNQKKVGWGTRHE